MSASSIDRVKALKAFPSQASPVDHGLYTITTQQQKELVPPDDHTHTEVWFHTPPLTLDTIKHINSIQLFAESHDQGKEKELYYGNWTWFEFAIMADAKSMSPRIDENGVELVWKSHRNRFQTSNFGWVEGRLFTENGDLLHLLEDGNVVAVRICGKYTWSKIAVRSGYLVIKIGDAEVQRKDVQYTRLVSQIKMVEKVLNEANVQTNAVAKPPIPRKSIQQADAFTTAGKRPLRVLSLDGGGVRGLASLSLLKAVLSQAYPNKRPWQIFDMIGGTSTGGLIAIMLGRLRMDIDECIAAYKVFMGKIFTHEHGKLGQIAATVLHGSEYGSKDLEDAVKSIVKEKLYDENALLFDDQVIPQGETQCKVFVMAVDSSAPNNRAPVYLRSYVNSQDPSMVPGIKLWEAARATSAAPTYFPPIKVGEYTFVDGGLQANNPLGWLWTEMLSVFGPARTTNCFLSIGTGIPANVPLEQKGNIFNYLSVATAVPSIATNTQVMHILFKCLINAFAPIPQGPKYWRLNIGEEIPEWKEVKHPFWDLLQIFEKEVLHPQDYKKLGDLDDVGSLNELMQMADTYIASQSQEIVECAAALRKDLTSKL